MTLDSDPDRPDETQKLASHRRHNVLLAFATAQQLARARVQPELRLPPADRLDLLTEAGLAFPEGAADGRPMRTMVLVLSTTCRFCSESASFYRRLVMAADSKEIPIMAVFGQSTAEAAEYLKRLEIPISDIRNSRPAMIQVRATPTLLVIDEKGSVERVWTGKLQSDKEEEILNLVRRGG